MTTPIIVFDGLNNNGELKMSRGNCELKDLKVYIDIIELQKYIRDRIKKNFKHGAVRFTDVSSHNGIIEFDFVVIECDDDIEVMEESMKVYKLPLDNSEYRLPLKTKKGNCNA